MILYERSNNNRTGASQQFFKLPNKIIVAETSDGSSEMCFFSKTILNAKGLYYSRYVESVKFEILLFSFRYNVPGVLVKSVKEKEY